MRTLDTAFTRGSGVVGCMNGTSEAAAVDRSYVNRMLRLTSLAPDIVEAIVCGDEPGGLSLRQLYDGVPLCWQEQRERWRRSSL